MRPSWIEACLDGRQRPHGRALALVIRTRAGLTGGVVFARALPNGQATGLGVCFLWVIIRLGYLINRLSGSPR
jgi:hypothetical protein